MLRYLASAFLCLLATSPANAQSSATGKKLVVSMTGLAAVAPDQPSAIGEKRSYREHDVVLSIPLAVEDTARAVVPVSFSLAGFDWTIPAGKLLVRARKASGGDLQTLPADTAIYCDLPFKRKGAFEARLLTLGLSTLVARLATELRICVVDADLDGRFDKGFLVGTNQPADRKLVDMAPTEYRSDKLQRIPGSRIEIVYKDGTALKGPSFALYLYRDNAQQMFHGIDLEPVPALKDMNGAQPWSGNFGTWIKPKLLPTRFLVGDAQLTVHAIDPTSREATISVDRDASYFRVSPWVAGVTWILI